MVLSGCRDLVRLEVGACPFESDTENYVEWKWMYLIDAKYLQGVTVGASERSVVFNVINDAKICTCGCHVCHVMIMLNMYCRCRDLLVLVTVLLSWLRTGCPGKCTFMCYVTRCNMIYNDVMSTQEQNVHIVGSFVIIRFGTYTHWHRIRRWYRKQIRSVKALSQLWKAEAKYFC